MSKIMAFKMKGGEDVVAEVVSTNMVDTMLLESIKSQEIKSYTLRRPHILRFQQVAVGQLGLAFVPWTLANPGISNVEVPIDAIAFPYETDANVEKQYIEQTSGISLLH